MCIDNESGWWAKDVTTADASSHRNLVINLIFIRKDSVSLLVLFIIALPKSSHPCGLSLRIRVQCSTPHDCVIQKAPTIPPPRRILPHHVGNLGLCSGCNYSLLLWRNKVDNTRGWSKISCVTYWDKHGVRSQ